MKILFYSHGDNGSLLDALRKKLADHQLYDWQSDQNIPKEQITAVIVWLPPDEFFDDLPNLTHVYALAAGVDHLLTHPGLPEDAAVIRLRDAGMGQQMAEYVLYGTLHAQRLMQEFRLAQAHARWDHHLSAKSSASTRVGILGAGALGQIVAKKLSINGYSVSCWSRTAHELPTGITSMHGQSDLPAFLSHSDVLVCLLPLTPSTQGFLNKSVFEQLPKGAYLINPGRGLHLIDNDLINALDKHHLSGALLDVFTEEPLPSSHPFWSHPRITITPHVAAKSLPDESAEQIHLSIESVFRGEQPAGIVDRKLGY